MYIEEKLFELQNNKYAEFQSKLIPTVDRKSIIGVKIPELRRIAKEYCSSSECELFINILPHKYYDENMLHGLLISEIKDYGGCVEALENFLPYVDNWAVCDSISPKCFKKHTEMAIHKIKTWIDSEMEYTCRFGIRMLMCHFLESDFNLEYPEIVASKSSREEYYVRMMVAWYFATALAKQWDSTIIYLEEKKLTDQWVHNKIIRKASESFRISDQQKRYLSTLKWQ